MFSIFLTIPSKMTIYLLLPHAHFLIGDYICNHQILKLITFPTQTFLNMIRIWLSTWTSSSPLSSIVIHLPDVIKSVSRCLMNQSAVHSPRSLLSLALLHLSPGLLWFLNSLPHIFHPLILPALVMRPE